MGWITKLFSSPQAAAFVMSDARTPIRSPWSSTSLTRIALADLAGLNPGETTRADAMKVPAVVRGRGLICGTLSRYPLTVWQPNPADPSGDTDTQLPTPAWMTSTSTGQSPITRMLWTLDDLIFAGMSVWATKRDNDGQIVDAIRIAPPYWHVDPDSLGVQVNGQPAAADEVIIFEGPQEGLLSIAADAVAASRALANAWQQRVKSPVPLVALSQTESNVELTDDEIDTMILDWEDARRDSATAFVPFGFKAEAMGTVSPDLYVEGRNAERLDWGNYIGLPAAMLDGSLSTATLTYSTSEGKRSEFVDYSLNYWASAIEARLSLDDVTPPGTYARFNLKWLTTPTQPGTNPPSED